MSVTGHRENVRLWVPVLTISESVLNRLAVARIRYESSVKIESGLYCHFDDSVQGRSRRLGNVEQNQRLAIHLANHSVDSVRVQLAEAADWRFSVCFFCNRQQLKI